MQCCHGGLHLHSLDIPDKLYLNPQLDEYICGFLSFRVTIMFQAYNICRIMNNISY